MSRFEKILLHASTSLATLTGVVYLFMKHALRRTDPFSAVNHPWQPHVLALHVLVGPVVVFTIGLITREHILGRFPVDRPRGSRTSGIATAVLAAPMIASGYLLQVVTERMAHGALVVAHLLTGGLFALLLVAHLLASSSRGRAAPRLDWPGERR